MLKEACHHPPGQSPQAPEVARGFGARPICVQTPALPLSGFMSRYKFTQDDSLHVPVCHLYDDDNATRACCEI